ncbi:MAG: hypothetical protein EPN74_02550 [Rhodanobacter sp.]|nr:MAG: hypothetical protein EPN74_02550 [Rhodanobacter sp.]
MKTSNITDFLDSNEVNGALSPLQAAQLLNLDGEGDTGAKAADTGGAPATTTVADGKAAGPTTADNKTTDSTASTTTAQPDKDNAVLLAKDGVHTIPYEKLEQARQGEQHWKAQAEATQLELAALKAAAQERADAGQAPTTQDNQVAAAQAAIEAGVDPDIFGDFSEEALAKGIQTLVDQRVNSMVTAKLNEALAPLREQQAQGATDAHYGAIYDKHPDADSIYQSVELANWVKAHPSYAQPALQAVLDGGSTAQVIELFDHFKSATKAPVTTTAGLKDAARAAVASAPTSIPTSLSDIPGGRASGISAHEQLAAMDPIAMANALAEMSQSERDKFLDRTF